MPEAAERYRGWEPPAPYMPHDGGLVLEIVEQTHHPGCHSLIWKRSQGSHLRKPKKAVVSIQWARFINCRIHGHRLLTWAITKKYRHEMIMRRSHWKKLSKKSSREKMEIGCSGICRILLGLSLIISMTVWERRKTFNTVTEGSTGCDAKRIKGDYPGRKWEGADGMIL